MTYEADIYNLLVANSGIIALVGDRVYWDVADGDAVAPFIVLQTVSTQGETAFDGSRDDSFPLVQFSAWAPTKLDAVALRQAIRAAAEGLEIEGDSKSSLGFSNSISSYDTQTKLFGEIIDYRVSTTTN
jgi:hypothetical protein